MSSWDHHQPCPGGCGELEDECMTPGCGSPLGSMRIAPPVGSQPDSTRVRALREGRTQWGHQGRHHGNGSPDCPRELHHHHDDYCKLPTLGECVAAGVPPRQPHQWDSRA